MILEATHTHLYPGHRGKISGLAKIADIQADNECLVEFSDGSVAPARISRSENTWQLYTDAYRTAAGSDIAAKLWLVGLGEDDGHVEFRILKKAHAVRPGASHENCNNGSKWTTRNGNC